MFTNVHNYCLTFDIVTMIDNSFHASNYVTEKLQVCVVPQFGQCVFLYKFLIHSFIPPMLRVRFVLLHFSKQSSRSKCFPITFLFHKSLTLTFETFKMYSIHFFQSLSAHTIFTLLWLNPFIHTSFFQPYFLYSGTENIHHLFFITSLVIQWKEFFIIWPWSRHTWKPIDRI